MVTVEEVHDAADSTSDEQQVLASKERLLDAQAIEAAAANVNRPTARMHLESLAKKMRKESAALERMEKSKAAMESSPEEENKQKSPPAPQAAALPRPIQPVAVTPIPIVSSSAKFSPIDKFAFDAGGYNAPFVTLYVPLPGVGSIAKDLVTCDFTISSFDLIVRDLKSKSYRLFKENLEKDIDPAKSKIIIKADKVVVKLAKVKQGDYGSYDYWSKLTEKKKRKTAKDGSREKEDPQASIMEMMKNMYDEGDDNMKKIIGETMLKQREGRLGTPGADGMGDLDSMM